MAAAEVALDITGTLTRVIESLDDIPPINDIAELEDFFNSPGAVANGFDITRLPNNNNLLSSMFLNGLTARLDNMIDNIKIKLLKTITPTPPPIDWNDPLQVDALFGTHNISLEYLQTTGAKPVKKIIKTNYQTIRDKFNEFKQAAQQPYSEFTTVHVEQSLFRKKFYRNCIHPQNMRLTDRNMYESLGIGTQCDEAYDMTITPGLASHIKNKTVPPTPLKIPVWELSEEREKPWKDFCYICNAPITNNDAQCEHILPVFQAVGFKCLLQASNRDIAKGTAGTSGIDDEFRRRLLRLEYAGAHPCCNLIKSNFTFIKLEPDATPPVSVDEDGITSVLTNIIAGANDSTNGQGCSSLKHLKTLDIPETITTMRENFLDLFVDLLNQSFQLTATSPDGSTGTFANAGLILFYYRYNQLCSFELCVEQTICSVLSNSEAIKNRVKAIKYVLYNTLSTRLNSILYSIKQFQLSKNITPVPPSTKSTIPISITEWWPTWIEKDADIINIKIMLTYCLEERIGLKLRTEIKAGTSDSNKYLESLVPVFGKFVNIEYANEFVTFTLSPGNIVKTKNSKDYYLKYELFITAILDLYYSDHQGTADSSTSNICNIEFDFLSQLLFNYVSLDLYYIVITKFEEMETNATFIGSGENMAAMAATLTRLRTMKAVIEQNYFRSFAEFIALYYTCRLRYISINTPELVIDIPGETPTDPEEFMNRIDLNGIIFSKLYLLLPADLRATYSNAVHAIGNFDEEINSAVYDTLRIPYTCAEGNFTLVDYFLDSFGTGKKDPHLAHKDIRNTVSVSARLKSLYECGEGLGKTERNSLEKSVYFDGISTGLLGGSNTKIIRGGMEQSENNIMIMATSFKCALNLVRAFGRDFSIYLITTGYDDIEIKLNEIMNERPDIIASLPDIHKADVGNRGFIVNYLIMLSELNIAKNESDAVAPALLTYFDQMVIDGADITYSAKIKSATKQVVQALPMEIVIQLSVSNIEEVKIIMQTVHSQYDTSQFDDIKDDYEYYSFIRSYSRLRITTPERLVISLQYANGYLISLPDDMVVAQLCSRGMDYLLHNIPIEISTEYKFYFAQYFISLGLTRICERELGILLGQTLISIRTVEEEEDDSTQFQRNEAIKKFLHDAEIEQGKQDEEFVHLDRVTPLIKKEKEDYGTESEEVAQRVNSDLMAMYAATNTLVNDFIAAATREQIIEICSSNFKTIKANYLHLFTLPNPIVGDFFIRNLIYYTRNHLLAVSPGDAVRCIRICEEAMYNSTSGKLGISSRDGIPDSIVSGMRGMLDKSTTSISTKIEDIKTDIEISVMKRRRIPTGIINMGNYDMVRYIFNTGYKTTFTMNRYNKVVDGGWPVIIRDGEYLKYGLPNSLWYKIPQIVSQQTDAPCNYPNFLRDHPDIYNLLIKYSLLYFINSASGHIFDLNGKHIYSVPTGGLRGGFLQKYKKIKKTKHIKKPINNQTRAKKLNRLKIIDKLNKTKHKHNQTRLKMKHKINLTRHKKPRRTRYNKNIKRRT